MAIYILEFLLGGIAGGSIAAVSRNKLPSYYDEQRWFSSVIFLIITSALTTSLVALLVGLHYQNIGATLAMALIVATVTPTLIATDMGKHLLPNAIIGRLVIVQLVALVAVTIFSSQDDAWQVLLRGILGGVVFFAIMLLLALAKTGLGFGDVKLAVPLGIMMATNSWNTLIYGILLGCILAGVAVFIMLITRLAHRKSLIAYGPYMILGAWVVWVSDILVKVL